MARSNLADRRLGNLGWLALTLTVALWSGCAAERPLEEHRIGTLGRIEYRQARRASAGIVIGIPRGLSEPRAVEYARTISGKTGAGLVIAYGFDAQRITVAQPLVYTSPIAVRIGDAQRPGSIYSEFRVLLRNAGLGPLKFYVGLGIAGNERGTGTIEVASSGLTFEQLKELKLQFNRIRDKEIGHREDVPKVEIALNPLDDISWNTVGVKNHGVLLLAEKGVILRLPRAIAHSPAMDLYGRILTAWLSRAQSVGLRNPSFLPEIRTEFTPLGRIDSIPSRAHVAGAVIGAPHGSFDRHTGEVVQALSYRTGLAAVIARGFTPTEAGGWRINVNRPSERRYPEHEAERSTDRSREVYRRFSEAVYRAAGGRLELYFDIHQSASQDQIEVATVGISAGEAGAIKAAFRRIRDRRIGHQAGIPKVEALIEPIDKLVFTALGAKKHGILTKTRRGLHIELPAHQILYGSRFRKAYTEILADWIGRIRAGAAERAGIGGRGDPLPPFTVSDR